MKTFQEFHESAWQRKEGKNKTGGLNEKGRKSYERENPGSDLKAPQPGGGPRKRSFCARTVSYTHLTLPTRSWV